MRQTKILTVAALAVLLAACSTGGSGATGGSRAAGAPPGAGTTTPNNPQGGPGHPFGSGTPATKSSANRS